MRTLSVIKGEAIWIVLPLFAGATFALMFLGVK